VRGGPIDWGGWGFPFGYRESAKDKVCGGLDDGQGPAFIITTIMEILDLPAMSAGIINPLEPSLRKLVSNKVHDHLTMDGGQNSLRVSKIFFKIISD